MHTQTCTSMSVMFSSQTSSCDGSPNNITSSTPSRDIASRYKEPKKWKRFGRWRKCDIPRWKKAPSPFRLTLWLLVPAFTFLVVFQTIYHVPRSTTSEPTCTSSHELRWTEVRERMVSMILAIPLSTRTFMFGRSP